MNNIDTITKCREFILNYTPDQENPYSTEEISDAISWESNIYGYTLAHEATFYNNPNAFNFMAENAPKAFNEAIITKDKIDQNNPIHLLAFLDYEEVSSNEIMTLMAKKAPEAFIEASTTLNGNHETPFITAASEGNSKGLQIMGDAINKIAKTFNDPNITKALIEFTNGIKTTYDPLKSLNLGATPDTRVILPAQVFAKVTEKQM
ncbi:MAG: hypothetical protein GY804_05790 [Alphaproteobacteria bacterium]|nr:hypothetical protein [Alphaproteobacteria bacterium]